MSNYNKTWVWVGIVIALIVGGLIGGFGFPVKVVDQDTIDSAVNESTTELYKEIEDLKSIIANYTEEEEEEVPVVELGYVIDEVFLEIPFFETLSDREVNLFDGEVEFDGDDYDAEEIFTLTGLELLANGNDFEGVPYLTILEGTISYVFEFEASLDLSNMVADDETLVFNLLGEEVTVSEWNDGRVTFSQGEEYVLVERGGVTIDEKVVVLDWVYENYVYVTVDDIGKKILEGSTKTVNGLEIRVSEVLYSATRESKAVLVIGEEVGFEVESGDEYAEDSIWEWIIDEHFIGLVLVEEFTELDEDYNALAPGESICLPNDYLCVVYNGVVEEDSEVYTFKLDDDFVRVKGNFEYGSKDYDKIYIHNETGLIYEDDKNLSIDSESYIGEEVELRDSNLVMLSDGTGIGIRNSKNEDWKNALFYVNLDLKSVFVDRNNEDFISWNETWNDISTKDEDFLTDYGILVENPKDSVKDKEFKITVPEEKLEATLTVV